MNKDTLKETIERRIQNAGHMPFESLVAFCCSLVSEACEDQDAEIARIRLIIESKNMQIEKLRDELRRKTT